MPDEKSGRGYVVAPEELNALLKTLGEVADAVRELLASAERLGRRPPLLGTSPFALVLADRLRATAGEVGLTGELGTAERHLRDYHRSLISALSGYVDLDETVSATLGTAKTVLDTAADGAGRLLP
ncbi:hypothetical protein FHX81_7771 [Saccharothrix saharensis]|uniref:Excreted virulence factor EspC (Type VII ESX diderm) n=1 Tax=Saccharothrix saharensis TaxID=571190 RepID=A0A543JR26_9PSEU|nr:hypothetical protein [Saccharothrix saharensis]TQM85292.1 hypothetical protein FHX81_7771 [Saccharothrix saharensis]